MSESAEGPGLEGLDLYHHRVKCMLRSVRKLLERFVWNWPAEEDQSRPQPSLHSVSLAVDGAQENCREPGPGLQTSLDAARDCLTKSKTTIAEARAGIARTTSHEIALEFALVIDRILLLAKAPYSPHDWDEIDEDYKIGIKKEAYIRMTSNSDNDIGRDDSDLFPSMTKRVGPEWYAFQKRFAGEFARQFGNLSGEQLDQLDAEIDLEFSKANNLPGSEKPKSGRDGTKALRKRMTRAEANEKAMTLAKQMKVFFCVVGA